MIAVVISQIIFFMPIEIALFERKLTICFVKYMLYVVYFLWYVCCRKIPINNTEEFVVKSYFKLFHEDLRTLYSCSPWNYMKLNAFLKCSFVNLETRINKQTLHQYDYCYSNELLMWRPHKAVYPISLYTLPLATRLMRDKNLWIYRAGKTLIKYSCLARVQLSEYLIRWKVASISQC